MLAVDKANRTRKPRPAPEPPNGPCPAPVGVAACRSPKLSEYDVTFLKMVATSWRDVSSSWRGMMIRGVGSPGNAGGASTIPLSSKGGGVMVSGGLLRSLPSA